MINKSIKNSFLSNNLKNTSESNISIQNPIKNLAVINSNKNQINNIFHDSYNMKNKSKIIPIGEVLSPNSNNDNKSESKIVAYSVDKENKKISNNSAGAPVSIFNKLTFDNAISLSKKSVNQLVVGQQDNSNNHANSNIISFNERNPNLNVNDNCNNNSNINNNNNYFEKLSVGSSKLDPTNSLKANNANNKILSNLNLKGQEILQLNNLNCFNPGYPSHNINNNINIISNNNFGHSDNFSTPHIPLIPPQQINVNINNYNINNYNIQSAIPLKSTKKFFNFNSSNNKNIMKESFKNSENELSPKNFSNMNNNILNLNNLNPLVNNNSNNNNNNLNNNESINCLMNQEYKEISGVANKKGFANVMNYNNGSNNNVRFNINKFFEENNGKIPLDCVITNNIYNNEKNNLEQIGKERERSMSNNFKNIIKEKKRN